MDIQRDIDILEFPIDGLAAYWLAIKKLVGDKRNFKPLLEEAEHTSEPFIQHLLENMAFEVPDSRLRHLAEVRGRGILKAIEVKHDLMRVALLDIAASENPRKTLNKMTAQFTVPPISEENAFALVQDMGKVAGGKKKAEGQGAYFNVDHRVKFDQLIVALLFFVGWARREGKLACQPLLTHVRSSFFVDGLSLVIDGFDAPFVRKRLRVHRETILDETRLKMEMSVDMASAIRDRESYEDVFRIAKAYIS
jgi:hypothetical protein